METIKTYLRWQLLNSTPGYVLPKAFDDGGLRLPGHKLRGQPEQRARWKRCVQATDAGLGEALSQVDVAQEFPPSSKQATQQMVKDIEAAMDQDHRYSGLDEPRPPRFAPRRNDGALSPTRSGYPDRWRNYSSLTIARYGRFWKRATRYGI